MSVQHVSSDLALSHDRDDFQEHLNALGRTTRGLRHPVRQVAKRIFDVTVSLTVIALFFPVFIFIACAICVQNPGNPFFLHRRVGRGQVEFGCIKFRTMVNDAETVLEDMLEADPAKRAEWDQTQKLNEDPRIIAGIGAFLRKSSLDELPQFFNILKGDMSLVGPRPVTRAEVTKYGSLAKYYFSVKPGLTGPWQIGGRSNTTYRERVTMDADYAANATLRTDLRIFLQTVRAFLTGRLSGAT
ncbi:MAG: sugar transferase [Pseudomonadota bacterium]